MCMRNETLSKLINEREDLKSQIDIINAKLKEIEKSIKTDMDQRIESARAKAVEKGETLTDSLGEIYEFDFDERHYKINYHHYEENKFDTDTFKRENPEMYAHYSTKEQRARLTIK